MVSIGEIIQKGPEITRDTGELQGVQGMGVLSMDKIQTYKGPKDDFIDDTQPEIQVIVEF